MIATTENVTGTDAGPARAQAELLDVKSVARLLSCSSRHVYRMADAGKLPRPRKLGALVRWSREDLSQWIGAGCPAVRSEERRVGKECRSRWSPYH